MYPSGTSAYRVTIAALAAVFVEDFLVDEGFGQYVLLGSSPRRPTARS